MYKYIAITCDYCNTQRKRYYSEIYKQNGTRKYEHLFCSTRCHALFQKNKRRKTVETYCAFCNAKLIKMHSEIRKSKSGNSFCNKSCAAKYNNTHKTTGNRRSKLEIYLEEQIKLNYPDLECICNGKELINAELDFYFPSLKFAIELNGIFHYEPIYGNDKLEKIQDNDNQKQIKCNNIGVELCVIDSSSCISLSKKQKAKYWNIVNQLLQKLYLRQKL